MKISVLGLMMAAFTFLGGASAVAEEGELMKIYTPAFAEGQAIPARHSVEGQNLSPALEWSGIPEGAESLALIVDDPDAPMGTFVHWVVYNLPTDVEGLPEGGTLPGDASEGVNDFGDSGYGGPMPPKGHGIHHYHFKLYALDTEVPLKAGASKADLMKAMEGHILAQAELMGIYERR
jgi:Raf kinase inhibitor-like YbhB/YbcL family protein